MSFSDQLLGYQLLKLPKRIQGRYVQYDETNLDDETDMPKVKVKEIKDHKMLKSLLLLSGQFETVIKNGKEEYAAFAGLMHMRSIREGLGNYSEIPDLLNLIADMDIVIDANKLITKIVDNNENKNDKLKRYLCRYIQKNEYNQEVLGQLLMFVTGKKSIPEQGLHIFENNMSQNHLPIAHTCFQAIEVPLYENFDQFESKLKDAIAYAQDSFELA